MVLIQLVSKCQEWIGKLSTELDDILTLTAAKFQLGVINLNGKTNPCPTLVKVCIVPNQALKKEQHNGSSYVIR